MGVIKDFFEYVSSAGKKEEPAQSAQTATPEPDYGAEFDNYEAQQNTQTQTAQTPPAQKYDWYDESKPYGRVKDTAGKYTGEYTFSHSARNLQEQLNQIARSRGEKEIAVDGYYGPETAAAVAKYLGGDASKAAATVAATGSGTGSTTTTTTGNGAQALADSAKSAPRPETGSGGGGFVSEFADEPGYTPPQKTTPTPAPAPAAGSGGGGFQDHTEAQNGPGVTLPNTDDYGELMKYLGTSAVAKASAAYNDWIDSNAENPNHADPRGVLTGGFNALFNYDGTPTMSPDYVKPTAEDTSEQDAYDLQREAELYQARQEYARLFGTSAPASWDIEEIEAALQQRGGANPYGDSATNPDAARWEQNQMREPFSAPASPAAQPEVPKTSWSKKFDEQTGGGKSIWDMLSLTSGTPKPTAPAMDYAREELKDAYAPYESYNSGNLPVPGSFMDLHTYMPGESNEHVFNRWLQEDVRRYNNNLDQAYLAAAQSTDPMAEQYKIWLGTNLYRYGLRG